jgi:hypothetical protein
VHIPVRHLRELKGRVLDVGVPVGEMGRMGRQAVSSSSSFLAVIASLAWASRNQNQVRIDNLALLAAELPQTIKFKM